MHTSIKAAVLATVIMFSGPLVNMARAWDIEKMNAQIEATNVIVSGVCSGSIIDKDKRLILTAYHCVTNNLREVEKKDVDMQTGEITTKKVMEKQPMYIEVWKRLEYDVVTAETHVATVKGWDAAADIAILEVADPAWSPVMAAPLAENYDYKRGRTVFAVGNPGIIFDNSVTTGIISAPARKLDFGDGREIPMFQHSASIIGGSSGGAIYNDSGEIIGTVSGGVRGADIGLAVPISKTKELLKKLGL